MEYVVTFLWKRLMRKRRLVLLKSPYKRIFSAGNAFVWITNVVIGYEFLYTIEILKRYGPNGVYSYFLAAFMHIIPLWSYLELTSVIPTSGGLYHYVYGSSNELMGFLTGWLQILGIISYMASIADKLAFRIDTDLFDNNVGKELGKYLGVDLSLNARLYLNDCPQVLRLFVIMTIAGLSTAIETANVVHSLVFDVILCAICCLCVLLAADLNLDYFLVPNQKCISTLFASYYDTNSLYTTIYMIVHLGGEVKQAEKNIPRAMLSSFIVTWIAFTVLPLILTLPTDIQNSHPNWIISSILEESGGYSLYKIVDVISIMLQFSALFVYFVSLSRVVVAMARDGLLFSVLSRVESYTQYPAKPNLLLGIVAGSVAMIFKKEFLEGISKITGCLLTCLAPVCVMMLRYTDAPTFMLKHKKDKATIIEPFEHAGVAVWAIAASTAAISILLCQWTAGYLIIEKFPTQENPYRLSIAGFVFVVSAGLLIYQKQNVLKTPYQVPFVPLVPVLSLFIQSFLFSVIPMKYVAAIGAWIGIANFRRKRPNILVPASYRQYLIVSTNMKFVQNVKNYESEDEFKDQQFL